MAQNDTIAAVKICLISHNGEQWYTPFVTTASSKKTQQKLLRKYAEWYAEEHNTCVFMDAGDYITLLDDTKFYLTDIEICNTVRELKECGMPI